VGIRQKEKKRKGADEGNETKKVRPSVGCVHVRVWGDKWARIGGRGVTSKEMGRKQGKYNRDRFIETTGTGPDRDRTEPAQNRTGSGPGR
jgi:hypothetical protein